MEIVLIILHLTLRILNIQHFFTLQKSHSSICKYVLKSKHSAKQQRSIFSRVARVSKAWVWELSKSQSKTVTHIMLARSPLLICHNLFPSHDQRENFLMVCSLQTSHFFNGLIHINKDCHYWRTFLSCHISMQQLLTL